jgi:RNA polymerase sigma-70 factor (ECF subfamily)
MLTDAEIMALVQAGDAQAFEKLVFRYRERLFRFALSKLGDRELAEDLVQETLLAAFRARASYSPAFAFSTWIWTILLNFARRQYRESQTRQSLFARYAAAQQQRASLSSNAIDGAFSEEREQLDVWLNLLPEEEADAIRLRFLGELKFEEVALAMESSVSGAKVRVKRGLLRLARLIHDHQDNV